MSHGQVPYHKFVGKGYRCEVNTCELGRKARVHRKAKDFPEPRLEEAERKIRRLEAGFRAMADYTALLETVIRTMSPFYGATGSALFLAEETWAKCLKRLGAHHEKYSRKTTEQPATQG